MLQDTIYGLVIKYPNHTNLLKEEVIINDNIRACLKRFENINTKGYLALRTDFKGTYLLIYNNPELEAKTHLYFYTPKAENSLVKSINYRAITTLGTHPTLINSRISDFALGKYYMPDKQLEEMLAKASIISIRHRQARALHEQHVKEKNYFNR